MTELSNEALIQYCEAIPLLTIAWNLFPHLKQDLIRCAIYLGEAAWKEGQCHMGRLISPSKQGYYMHSIYRAFEILASEQTNNSKRKNLLS